MTTKLYLDNSDIQAAVRALQAGADKGTVSKPAFTAIANAAGVTWTAAQALSGIIARSGAAGVSDTTPTAALLVAAFAALNVAGALAVGDVVTLRVRNNNTGTLTLVAGSGVTLEGTTTIPTVNFREYLIRFTNVTVGAEAVTVSGLFQAAI